MPIKLVAYIIIPKNVCETIKNIKYEVTQWLSFAPFASLLKDCSCMQMFEEENIVTGSVFIKLTGLWLVMNDWVIVTV